jgi:hypothetical protein
MGARKLYIQPNALNGVCSSVLAAPIYSNYDGTVDLCIPALEIVDIPQALQLDKGNGNW